jgi:hypothetical protein
MQLLYVVSERVIDLKDIQVVALMAQISDAEPTIYEDVAKQQVWKDAMVEEYQSIMKNDVWEVVPRPKGKSVVTSKWLFKIKHAVDGSIENTKRDLWLVVFLKMKVFTMMKHSHLLQGTIPSRPSFPSRQF